MRKLFNLYIDREFLVLVIFGIKISLKLSTLEEKLEVENSKQDCKKNRTEVQKVKDGRKRLAIVRLDAIGDYILFRPFLKSIREYYNDYHITYIGNILHRDFIENFDCKYVDDNIFINIFTSYDITIIKDLKYDIVISPVYSRTHYTDEFIKLIVAKEKIASYGNLTNISDAIKAQGNINYTRLIYHKNIDFEFYINKYFFEVLFEKEINIDNTNFDLDKEYFNNIDFDFNQNYVIFFPSASDVRRRWSFDNFKKLAEYIYKKCNYHIYIAGNQSDEEIANKIIDNKYSIYSICDKYELHMLPYIFSKAKFIVTNDTMAYHMAVATNGKVLCISNGSTYTRFVNYPKKLIKNKRVIQIFPKEFRKKMNSNSFENYDYEHYSMYDINKIEVEEVLLKLDEYFIK